MNSGISTIEFATLIWAFIIFAAVAYGIYSKSRQRGYFLDKNLK